MNRKGVNALELVFGMFILIVVTLVIIRLFASRVTESALPKIEDFQQAYDYDKQVSVCKSLCSAYTSTCEDLSSAVDFCRKKVKIDIDGTFKSGEKGHYGIVKGQPYCEDGLYCFHLMECSCGSYVLDARSCLGIMIDYYTETVGYDLLTAKEAIFNAIQPGTCPIDPRTWSRKLPIGYNVTRALGADVPYGVSSPSFPEPVIGADYWWKKAGYSTLITGGTTTIPGGALTLSNCVVNKATNTAQCDTNLYNCIGTLLMSISPATGNPISGAPTISGGRATLNHPAISSLVCPVDITLFCANPEQLAIMTAIPC